MAQSVFSLSLFHDYYSDKKWNDALLVPDSITSSLISRYSLSLLRLGETCHLLYFGDSPISSFLSYLVSNEITCLEFNLQTDSDRFYKITDLPQNFDGQLVFESSIISEPIIEDSLLAGRELIVAYNRNSLAVANSIGKVTISLSDLLEHPQSNNSFSIRLKARQTSWRYCLFNRSRRELTEPVISDQQDFKFDGPIKVSIAGEQGMLFDSGESCFPMSEFSEKTFSLKENRLSYVNRLSPKTKLRTLVNKLPTPTPENVQFQALNGKEFGFSQMYVYL